MNHISNIIRSFSQIWKDGKESRPIDPDQKSKNHTDQEIYFHSPQEIVAPSFRNVSSSLMMCCFSLSFLLIDLVAYFERHWRHLQLYLAIPSLLSILVFCYVPESPRWCLSKGNVHEANRLATGKNLPRRVLGKMCLKIFLPPPLFLVKNNLCPASFFRMSMVTTRGPHKFWSFP